MGGDVSAGASEDGEGGVRVCQLCVSDEATEEVGELQLCAECGVDYTAAMGATG